MHETMSYIFATLEQHKLNLRIQKKINFFTAIAVSGLLVVSRMQTREIKALKAKVNELTTPVETVEE